MWAESKHFLNGGELADPSDKYRCRFFDAIIAPVIGAISDAFAPAALAGAADIGAGTAATVLPEVAVTAPAIGAEAAGAEAALAGVPALASAAPALAEAGGGLAPDLAALSQPPLAGAADILLPTGNEPTGLPISLASNIGGVQTPTAGAGGGALSTPATTGTPGSLVGGIASPTATPAPAASSPELAAVEAPGGLSGDPSLGQSLLEGQAPLVNQNLPSLNVNPGEGAASASTGADLGPEGKVGGDFGGTGSKGTFSGIGDWLKNNSTLLGLGIGGAGLLSTLLGQNQIKVPQITTPQANTATGTAAALAPAAATVPSNVQSLTNVGAAETAQALEGVLPQGYEQAIEQAKRSSEAAIRSTYANLGMSGSSSEAQDIAANANNIDAQRAALLSKFLTEGINTTNAAAGAGTSAAGTAGSIDTALSAQQLQEQQIQIAQDQELQQALSSLAGNLMRSSLPVSVIQTSAAA